MSDIDALVETVREALRPGMTPAEAIAALAALSELAALAREAQEDLSATRDAMEAGRHLREAAEGERDRLKDALRAIRETTFENDWFEAQAIARAALADVGGTEETGA